MKIHWWLRINLVYATTHLPSNRVCLLRISWFIYHLLSSPLSVCRWVSDVLMIFQRKRSWHSISTKHGREPPGLTLWTFITGGVFQNEFHTSQTFYPVVIKMGSARVTRSFITQGVAYHSLFLAFSQRNKGYGCLQTFALWWTFLKWFNGSRFCLVEFPENLWEFFFLFGWASAIWRRHRQDQSTLQNGLFKGTLESHFPFPWRWEQ